MKTKSLFQNVFWSVIMSLTIFFNAFSQVSHNNSEAIELLAGLCNSGVDKTSSMLEEIGFVVPSNLKSEWKAFPAIRKIETAYFAAESISKKNGQQMLALMSQNLAQQYESIHFEPALKDFLKEKMSYRSLQFGTLIVDVGESPLDIKLKNAISSICKYSDANLLGGAQGILKHKFGLSDEVLYDVLRKARSNTDALAIGLSKSKVPPSFQERLKGIVKEITSSYEAARYDKDLLKVLNKDTPKPHVPIAAVNGARGKSMQANLNKSYRKFRQISYPSGFAFKTMRVNIRGFGGVIFGNEFISDINVQLNSMQFIPDKNNQNIGVWQFIFSDNSIKTISPVLAEDLFIAERIIFGVKDHDVSFNHGEGVGLVGISEPLQFMDSNFMVNRRFKIITHPSLYNRELGACAAAVDAIPITKKGLLEKLSKELEIKELNEFKVWSLDSASTWKITDVPLSISFNDQDEIVTTRIDCPSGGNCRNSYLMMTGFYDSKEYPIEVTSFYSALPTLTKYSPEYARINQFAKIFTIMRWATSLGVSFQHPLNEPNMIQHLPYLIINDSNQSLEIPNENKLFSCWSLYRSNLIEILKEKIGEGADFSDVTRLIEEISDLRQKQWNAILSNQLDKICVLEDEIKSKVSSSLVKKIKYDYFNDRSSEEKLADLDSLSKLQDSDRTTLTASMLLYRISIESEDIRLLSNSNCQYEKGFNYWYLIIIFIVGIIGTYFLFIRK